MTKEYEEQLLASVRLRPRSLGQPYSTWTRKVLADYMAEQTGIFVLRWVQGALLMEIWKRTVLGVAAPPTRMLKSSKLWKLAVVPPPSRYLPITISPGRTNGSLGESARFPVKILLCPAICI